MNESNSTDTNSTASTVIADSKAPLVVSQLHKTFRQGKGQIEALKHFDMDVQRGEFVAIMGASGSGKSTLLHLVAGLTKPDNGTVAIDGNDIFQMSDSQLTRFRRQQIGLVFQSFNLVPSLSSENNVLLPLMSEGKSQNARQRLDQLLQRLGLEERRHHKPNALSGGEQQRVAIARALITDPALLLADEPTGSLDSVTGQSICQLLAELAHEQQRTIIVVTHEPSVAIWAERVVVLKDGARLTEFNTSQFDDAQSLAAYYHNVAATPPMY